MRKNVLQFLDLGCAGCTDKIVLNNSATSSEINHTGEDGLICEELLKLAARFLETKVRRVQKKMKRPRIRNPEPGTGRIYSVRITPGN